MGKLSQSMIDKAAHANLVAYCQSHGIELKREGKEFVIKANDSIYISAEQPFKWYRHSTGEGGKAVDFAMQYLGMPFRDAYKKVGLDIEAGTFMPNKDIHHTHEGSIGNLCTDRIAVLMQQVMDGFGFERVRQAEKKLLK